MGRREFRHDGLKLSYMDPGGDGRVLIALHAHFMEAAAVSAGEFLVEDEGLAERAARMAQALHARVFPGQAVLAQAAETLVDVAHNLLVADHEDEPPGGVGVRTELATGP